MSKFGALVLIIILLGAVFYVYNQNVNNIGVKIDKLKLKYTIGEGASADKILLFSEDLSKMAKDSSNVDKKRLEFESKFWYSAGLAKEVSSKLGTGDNYSYKCDSEVSTMKTQIKTAIQGLKEAKLEYELIKPEYTNLEQKDFEARFENVEYSLTASDNLLYIYCP